MNKSGRVVNVLIVMLVKLTNSIVVKGFAGVQKGDVIDASPSLAAELLQCGNAVPAAETPPTRVAVIETREPEVENRDPGFNTESASPLTKRSRRKPS